MANHLFHQFSLDVVAVQQSCTPLVCYSQVQRAIFQIKVVLVVVDKAVDSSVAPADVVKYMESKHEEMAAPYGW